MILQDSDGGHGELAGDTQGESGGVRGLLRAPIVVVYLKVAAVLSVRLRWQAHFYCRIIVPSQTNQPEESTLL